MPGVASAAGRCQRKCATGVSIADFAQSLDWNCPLVFMIGPVWRRSQRDGLCPLPDHRSEACRSFLLGTICSKSGYSSCTRSWNVRGNMPSPDISEGKLHEVNVLDRLLRVRGLLHHETEDRSTSSGFITLEAGSFFQIAPNPRLKADAAIRNPATGHGIDLRSDHRAFRLRTRAKTSTRRLPGRFKDPETGRTIGVP